MKCPETGMLQAYIDGELSIRVRKDIEGHMRACAECAESLARLKEADDFIFEKLSVLGDEAAHPSRVSGNRVGENLSEPSPHINSSMKPEPAGNSTASAAIGKQNAISAGKQKAMKGVFDFMNRYRKFAAAACIMLIAAGCIFIQPVRAAISDALDIFRVDKLEGIRISPQEIVKIRESLSSGVGDLTLESLGRIRVTGGLSKPVTRDGLADACRFSVLMPENRQGPEPELTVIEPLTLEFTLDTEKANRVLKSLNSPESLPDEIDGKTFTVTFAAQACIKYESGDKIFTLYETTTPEIAVPAGVDIDNLFNVIVGIPIFPDELKLKLKSVSDWKNALYLPVFNYSGCVAEEIVMNGTNAYVATGKDMNGRVRSSVIWMKGGIIFGLSADSDGDELVHFAKGLK